MSSADTSPEEVPDEATSHKNTGGRFFARQDYAKALASYQSALSCLPARLTWPKHERLALTLHSNSALCLLKLNQPRKAAQECQKARSLPVFQVQAPENMREKVLARHAEALLDWRADCMDDGPSNDEIWSILDEARARGYLCQRTCSSSLQTRRKFLHLAARLSTRNNSKEDAVAGLKAWTDRLVRTSITTAVKAAEARQRVQEAAAEVQERHALDALESLLPPPNTSASVGEVCRYLISFILRKASPLEAVTYLRQKLTSGALHASQVDEDGQGYFLWAICYGLSMDSQPGEESIRVFLALLSLLVDDFGVCIDQRATTEADQQSRNPLQYVVKSGRPQAVRAMLHRGARVNLRDDAGWTALHAICMNDVMKPEEGGPSPSERVEVARLLVDAGADLDAETLTGFTPLLSLCTDPCKPLVEFLLVQGANRDYHSPTGFTASNLLAKLAKDSEEAKQCQRLLCRSKADMLAMEEDVKAVKFQELIKMLVGVNNDFSASNPSRNFANGLHERATQELEVLKALFEHLDMNPGVLRKSLSVQDGNWLEELHLRLNAQVPACYLKVYFGEPNEKELSAMLAHSGEAYRVGYVEDEDGIERFDREAAISALFGKWRYRGLVYEANMNIFNQLVIDSIQHSVGFAVPSEKVLRRIQHYGPVVECGAGTAYWTAVLRTRGVDAIAYDLHPPTEDHEASRFFNFTYTKVHLGDGKRLFTKNPALSHRTLLLVWPNNPDREDNPHLYFGEDLPPVWDADCLEDYMKAGGSTVVYVGEREEIVKTLPGAQPDCGVSSSRRFQNMLKEHFQMVEQLDIPRWSLCEDDVTIWKRMTPEK